MAYASDYVESYDDLFDQCFDQSDPHLLALEDSPVVDIEQMKHLSNVDYSLNSPLISDEIDGFIRWWKTGQAETRWDIKKWTELAKTFKLYIKPELIKDTTKFTQWFGKFNLKENFKIVSSFRDILEHTRFCEQKTKPVVEAFLKGWVGKSIDLSKLNFLDLPVCAKKWGHLFWELHIAALLLNCTTKKEQEYLTTSFNARPLNSKKGFKFEFFSENFGRIVISNGFALFPDQQLLIDRNTILMMKDTYIARFNTLLSMSNRIDNIFQQNSWNQIVEMYRLGDKILVEAGSEGYNSIKLLEPMCNERFIQLSQKYRPLIPLFSDFRQHVEGSVEELSGVSPSLKNLWNLILKTDHLETVLTMYGSFRHWGHPFIDYFAGLEKLYNQVNMVKNIDKVYASKLASDLAFLVLKSQFKSKKRWQLDATLISDDHELYPFISKNTWPNTCTIKNFGDRWHTLPLNKCFDIPDVIDPSIIYSDKSHSYTRSEIRTFLRNPKSSSIPTHKVLSSLLKNPSTDWPSFLKKVNDHGIDENQLVIGLKPKERELKISGRFFSLMSWEIRDYFVMTEYLIKTHFVPLFEGLTMADDLTTVVGKMLENTDGQGELGYEKITIADHIDYEKWNNHQRGDANNPVFRVMGQFLGYPKLIERTHEIFEKSWIYYNNRGDLMRLDIDGNLVNKTKHRVCWLGQKGGLEGLRQKGWSIVNLLVLQRESSSVNTTVKVLAQGDNQVVCSKYKLRPHRTEDQLLQNIKDVCENNRILMNRISDGTGKLGLIINHDETMKSSEFLNYGKNCVFRGNIRNLETKRWSRVNCVTNDQLPTLANVLSTTSSNALTVAHYSDSPINSMALYNFYGHFVRRICEIHNPAIRGPVDKVMKLKKTDLVDMQYLVSSLYLDPSLGGVCGMSLTRFLIRVFPDPITESLTFLKIVHDNTSSSEIKGLMIQFGHPPIRQSPTPDLTKLIEDPLSLNIPKGIDAITMIKDEIKKSLQKSVKDIKNIVIKKAVQHQIKHEQLFLSHIKSIKPLFPRFLSEYRSSTYFGIVDSIIQLFQNSKTIRNQFKGNLHIHYDSTIIRSEIHSISVLLGRFKKNVQTKMWGCSAHQADILRRQSWGSPVHGATIPHPGEFFGIPQKSRKECNLCNEVYPKSMFISILIPEGFQNLKEYRGKCSAYLGSSTMESTSILQTWERETKIPMLRRAASLRGAIGWFVDPTSNLAKSITNNLQSLTGEDWSKSLKGFKRTGSALHRFKCSRQSSGGYAAQNPSKLTRMISTTNSLSDLGDINYDFMFQSCLLNALMSVGEIHKVNDGQGFYHQHIKCSHCLREIKEISLECGTVYNHPSVVNDLKYWKPEDAQWSLTTPSVDLAMGDWDSLSVHEKSYHIGFIQGFVYGDSTWGKSSAADDPALFPLTIRKRVSPDLYCQGLIEGILYSSTVSIIHQRRLKFRNQYHNHILGHASLTIDRLIKNPNILNIWREDSFQRLFASIPHHIPPSFPMVTTDISTLGGNYLKSQLALFGLHTLTSPDNQWENHIWVFADTYRFDLVSLLGISKKCVSLLKQINLTKQIKLQLDQLRILSTAVRDSDKTQGCDLSTLGPLLNPLRYTDREVRHASKGMSDLEGRDSRNQLQWGPEFIGKVTSVAVEYNESPKPAMVPNIHKLRYQNPLISGLRLAQLATGSHYKLRAILSYLKIEPKGAICGGDGSGGISALIMRLYPNCRVIFNSLCLYSNVQLKGNTPSPPSAIIHTTNNPDNCVNLRDCWAHPNDLSKGSTWRYFFELISKYCMEIDLIILDMEVTDDQVMSKIEMLLGKWSTNLRGRPLTIVFKTYLTRIFGCNSNILTEVGPSFTRVEIVTTSLSSSQTSEVYVILQHVRSHSHTRQVYPDLASVRQNVNNFPLFSSPFDEFTRAQKLFGKDLLCGVPTEVRTDPQLELMTLLNLLDVRSDLSYIYAQELGGHNRSDYLPIALFALINHALFPFTTPYISRPSVPSDGKIINIGVWVTGFFIWLGFIMRSFPIAQLGQDFITYYFPFNFKTELHEHHFLMKWSNTEPGDIAKNLQLDSKLAMIGSIIRILHLNFYNRTRFPSMKVVNDQCKRFNKAVTYERLNDSTHLIDVLRAEKVIEFSGSPERISLIVGGVESESIDLVSHRS